MKKNLKKMEAGALKFIATFFLFIYFF
jgi:hypothetical protein